MSDKKENTNQNTSGEGTKTFFRSYSVYATCAKCKNSGATKSAQSCSIMNCCFAYCCGAYWFCYTAKNTKDFNCTNTVHYCNSCGEPVGEYTAC